MAHLYGRKKSPAKVLSDLFTESFNENDFHTYDKGDLIDIINIQKGQIDSLNVKLDSYIQYYGVGRARIKVETEGLNRRHEPVISGELMDRIPNGSLVGIIRFDDNEQILEGESGKWCLIKYAGQEGWVWGNYLEILE